MTITLTVNATELRIIRQAFQKSIDHLVAHPGSTPAYADRLAQCNRLRTLLEALPSNVEG